MCNRNTTCVVRELYRVYRIHIKTKNLHAQYNNKLFNKETTCSYNK